MAFSLKAAFKSNLTQSAKDAEARLSGANTLDDAIQKTNPFDQSTDDILRDNFVKSSS